MAVIGTSNIHINSKYLVLTRGILREAAGIGSQSVAKVKWSAVNAYFFLIIAEPAHTSPSSAPSSQERIVFILSLVMSVR